MNSNNNISFKSNIKFGPLSQIKQLNKKGVEIGFLFGEKNNIKAAEFYTCGIKTYTAGGLVTPNKEALGFHYLDVSFLIFVILIIIFFYKLQGFKECA